MKAYEYLMIDWKYSMDGGDVQTWRLWHPRNEGRSEVLPADTNLFVLANQFGREGWKMVTFNVLESGMFTERGINHMSTPVHRRWMFVRETQS